MVTCRSTWLIHKNLHRLIRWCKTVIPKQPLRKSENRKSSPGSGVWRQPALPRWPGGWSVPPITKYRRYRSVHQPAGAVRIEDTPGAMSKRRQNCQQRVGINDGLGFTPVYTPKLFVDQHLLLTWWSNHNEVCRMHPGSGFHQYRWSRKVMDPGFEQEGSHRGSLCL